MEKPHYKVRIRREYKVQYPNPIRVAAGERVVVGVNKFISEAEPGYQPLRVDPAIEEEQAKRLAQLRAARDGDEWRRRIDDLKRVAAGQENVLFPLRGALAAQATVGEVCNALADVWGRHRPSNRL